MYKHEEMAKRMATNYLGQRLVSRRAAIQRAEYIAQTLRETVVVVIWETNVQDFPDKHDHEYEPILWETWHASCASLNGVRSFEHIARG